MHEKKSIKYRPEIDGLRSIAVIPVILFHLGYDWINGGYFGVDVFFVISGFLITSIILKEVNIGSFSLKNFWVHRIKRIMPALVTMVLTTLFVAPLLMFKGDVGALASDATAALFSYANFHMFLKFGDYWGASAESSFFLHAWSLSVEEQFYLFYPLFILFLHKYRLSVSKWLLAIIFLSFLTFIAGSIFFPTATFYLLPTRAWELASGGLLAAVGNPNARLHDRAHHKYRQFIPTVGLILIFSSYFVFTGEEGINMFAILPVLGAVMIIGFSSKGEWIGRILSSNLLVFIGKISYSLYLWHWPIIVFLNNYYATRLSDFRLKFIAIILTIICSLLSYYLVENRTRRWKYTPKLVLAAVIFAISFIFLLRSSIINKEYNSPFNQVVFYGLYYDITPKIIAGADANKAKRKGILAPERSPEYSESYKNGGIVTNKNLEGNPKVIVLGDSHGAMWAKVIDEIASENAFKVSFYTSVGSTPFFNTNNLDEQDGTRGFTAEERVSYAKRFMTDLKNQKPELLIIACKWSGTVGDRMANFEELLKVIRDHKIKVLVLNQPPIIDAIGDRNTAQYLTYLGYQPGTNSQYIRDLNKFHIEKVNYELKAKLAEYPNVGYFDVYSQFAANENKALVVHNKDVLYYDDDHLSYQGTSLLKGKLTEKINGLTSDHE